MIAEEYVNFVTDEIITKALRREVLEAALEDATLTAVQELQVGQSNFYTQSRWSSLDEKWCEVRKATTKFQEKHLTL